MIDCVFTVDYEIYGNGEGSLRELVYEPAERLRAVFKKWAAPWVVFVEAAELEVIGSALADPAIALVERQVREMRADGVEIGLHLHPQWYNAHLDGGSWVLDHDEYNLCRLSPDRIDAIIGRSISYLRRVLDDPDFTPLSFRAGNWLLQPTSPAARSLVKHGIKIDSSVFKGGLQRRQGLDYRRALKNGYHWTFTDDVNVPDPEGILLELPTYTRMVPPWEMLTPKRLGLRQKSSPGTKGKTGKLSRLADFARIRQPMKLDFCRQTAKELTGMLRKEMERDRSDPSINRPIVAIGHTKDLIDIETLDTSLAFMRNFGIAISTFSSEYEKAIESRSHAAD